MRTLERWIADCLYEELRQLDVGAYFSEQCRGERVPTLAEVLRAMKEDSRRWLYLDLKKVEESALVEAITREEVGERVIIASPSRSQCRRLKALNGRMGTMLWIGGAADQIKARFALTSEEGFAGLDQVQVHLHPTAGAWPFALSADFLRAALATCQRAGKDFEVFLMQHTDEGVRALLDLGLRWFAVDDAAKFQASLLSWNAGGQENSGGSEEQR